MKFRLIILESKVPDWMATARAEYIIKISGYVPFELRGLKAPAVERDHADVKRRKEGEKILAEVDDKDLLVLFDERGKLSRSSEDFATQMTRVLESGKKSVTFCIGGAYGFSDSVYERADLKWSLSPLTMNHWVAQLTALEQIFRAFTIIKGIPYHNR